MIGPVLWVFARLRRPLERAGVDHPAFMAILRVKLIQDRRRVRFGRVREGTDGTFTLTLVMFTLMGLLIGSSLLGSGSTALAVTMIHAVVMMMIGLLLVGDFTSVLVDTADNSILLPRPVDGRTVLAARTAHIVSYLGVLALSLSGGSMVIGAFAVHPLFPVLLLITVSLSLAIVVSAVYVVYLLAMKRADLERFRDVVLWFQIGLMVVVYGGYQLIPRLLGRSLFDGTALTEHRWLLFLPPAWMAGPHELLQGRAGGTEIALTSLAIVVPLLCLWLILRFLAPGFGEALAALDSSAAGSERKGREVRAGRLARVWARLLAREGEERAAFLLIWSVASRDRAFKLATYPAMAILAVLLGMLAFGGPGGVEHSIEQFASGRLYLLAPYLCCFVCPLAVESIRFSEHHRAAWIWFAAPLESPGSVLAASVEVALARFGFPVFALVSAGILALVGPRALPDIALTGSILILVTLVVARTSGGDMPFSRRRTGQQAGHGLVLMLSMLLLGGLMFVHGFLLMGHPLARLVPAAVILLVSARGLGRYRRSDWSRIPLEGEFD